MRVHRTQSEKFQNKRKQIVDLAKQYIEKDGKVNMTKFRKEHTNIYTQLNYYFKGVDGLLEAINPELINDSQKKSTGRGCPVNGQSVRNELAYDMLILLRKNHTLHEIGEMYGVSRAHIHQLIQAMERTSYFEERPIKLSMLV